MAVKTAAYILFEMYDSCRLWKLSHNTIEGVRLLNLRQVLCKVRNAIECRCLLDAIESSRFR